MDIRTKGVCVTPSQHNGDQETLEKWDPLPHGSCVAWPISLLPWLRGVHAGPQALAVRKPGLWEGPDYTQSTRPSLERWTGIGLPQGAQCLTPFHRQSVSASTIHKHCQPATREPPALPVKWRHTSPFSFPPTETHWRCWASQDPLLPPAVKKGDTGHVLGRSKIDFSPIPSPGYQPWLWRIFARKGGLDQFVIWVSQDSVLALPALLVLVPGSASLSPQLTVTASWSFLFSVTVQYLLRLDSPSFVRGPCGGPLWYS